MPLHINSPLVESLPLSRSCGRKILLKLDNTQPSGSFKIRGIGVACKRFAGEGRTRFVSSSGGNAGLAVSYAGRQLAIPVVVVVPRTTSSHAIGLIRREGAEVIVHGASWQEANALAQSLLEPDDAFLHPFDHPLLWQGHATMIEEIDAAGVRPDGIVLSVGGGGLLAGVIAGLDWVGWGDTRVVAVETAGAASLAKSLAAGQRVTLDAIDTIATSLGAKQVAERAFELAVARQVRSVTLSDHDAVAAIGRFLDDHRMLVEPACAVSLAVAYRNHPALADLDTCVIVVCGGSVVDIATWQSWSAQLATVAEWAKGTPV